MEKSTYMYLGITLIIFGIILLIWFYILKNNFPQSTPVFGFLTIGLGARFLRLSFKSN